MNNSQYKTDLNALFIDLEHELKPLIPYCKVIYINNKLKSISLKDNIKTKDICLLFNCKQKELIKLFNWFNDNLIFVSDIINSYEDIKRVKK